MQVKLSTTRLLFWLTVLSLFRVSLGREQVHSNQNSALRRDSSQERSRNNGGGFARPGRGPPSPGRDEAIDANQRDACPRTRADPHDSNRFKMKVLYTIGNKDINCCGCDPGFKYVGRCKPNDPSSTRCEPCEEGTHIDKYAHFETICRPREGVGTVEDRNVALTTTAAYSNKETTTTTTSLPTTTSPVQVSLMTTRHPTTSIIGKTQDGIQPVHGPYIASGVASFFAAALLSLGLYFIWKHCCRDHGPDVSPERQTDQEPRYSRKNNRQDSAVINNPTFQPLPQSEQGQGGTSEDGNRGEIVLIHNETQKKCDRPWKKLFRSKKTRSFPSRQSSTSPTQGGGLGPDDPTSSSAQLLPSQSRPATQSNFQPSTNHDPTTSHSQGTNAIPTQISALMTPSTLSTQELEKKKVERFCHDLRTGGYEFFMADVKHFCKLKKLDDPPSSSTEHPSWIFADVIETNIAADRISRIEVLTFLRNRGWNTPYEKSLELGTEVERSVVEAANSNAADPV